MSNEFKHKSAGTQLTQTEDDEIGRHVFNNQAAGDIPYASSTTQISRRGIGDTNDILTVTSGVPAWTSTPTLDSLTISTTAASEIINSAETLFDVTYGGTLSSGGSMVGGNFAVTPTGTGGVWVAGVFASVTQGATKAVDGYISAGEFELNNSAANASAMSCLTLNWNNSSSSPGAPGGSTQAYIQLRDYSAGTPCSALFEFTDITVGSKDTTSLICAVGTTATVTHVVRFTVKNTPYWFLVRNVAPD